MPELPEVETMVRGIRPYVEGREIAVVRRCRCRCQPISIIPRLPQIAKRTKGVTITTVRRLAKRVVLELASGDSFVIEPRMTGLMLLTAAPDRQHLRLQWRFAETNDFNSLWFWDRRGLGTVRLYTPAELTEHLGPRKLGRDALQMTETDWQNSCRKTTRAIKVALLDQKLVAGIGNLYSSEILHHAGIHPAHPADGLKPRQIRRLHAAVQDVLTSAIRCEGSTLGDGTYRNVLNRSGSYQNEHRVYQCENQSCRSCGRAKIRRIVQAQRSTFFCPVCQR